MQIELGMRVRVRREQDRISGALYPGREGVVVADNFCGANMDGGYWYVLLRGTKRAKERVVLFPGMYLEAAGQPGHTYSPLFLAMAYGLYYPLKRSDLIALEFLLNELDVIEKEDGFVVVSTIRHAVEVELQRRGSEVAL